MASPLLYTDEHPDGKELPFKWVICRHCDGHGKSSAYLGAFTHETWGELDDEWKDDYIAGNYDRPCECCAGSGKVQIVDRAKMTKAEREAWHIQCEEERSMRAIERAERAFGC